MSNIGSQLTEAFAGLDRTEEIMNMAAEDLAEERPIKLSSMKGDIVFEDVHFAYDEAVSYTHLRAHETVLDLVCRLLLEKKHHFNAIP